MLNMAQIETLVLKTIPQLNMLSRLKILAFTSTISLTTLSLMYCTVYIMTCNAISFNGFQSIETNTSGQDICHPPMLDPWNRRISKFFKQHSPLVCKKVQEDLASISEDGKFNLTKKNLSCNYECYNGSYGDSTPLHKYKEGEFLDGDAIDCECTFVTCKSRNGTMIYQDILTNVQNKFTRNLTSNASARTDTFGQLTSALSAHVIIFESTTQSSFFQNFPLTSLTLMQHLKAIRLQGHSR